MFKKNFLFTLLIIGLVVGSLLVSQKIASAATAASVADQSGTFATTVGGNDITFTASTGVIMTIGLDDATTTTSATVSAVHPKGERMFGMDSDGGPLYYISTDVGVTSPTAVASVTGSDDFTAGWSPL